MKNGLENAILKAEFNDKNKEDIIKEECFKYLDKDIINIENNCGIISFNKINYRIALMVKIKSETLKVLEKIDILKKEDIKIDTIILKRLNK